VSDSRGVRSLHIGGEAIQSAMRLEDPYALALDYTRCMMGFLLFHPEPREALMIGLGGGSLAKFFHHRLRATRTRVIELDPRIVAVARAQFALPPDDARLAVEIGDGAESLSPECCDVLVVDAYRDEQHVPELATGEFYDAAYLALAEPGVLVVNFMDDDPNLDRQLRRVEAAFGGTVLALPSSYDPNVIAFALKGISGPFAWRELRSRAGRLEARYGLPFRRFVNGFKRMNRSTSEALLTGAEA
jgi:spermidine synthase